MKVEDDEHAQMWDVFRNKKGPILIVTRLSYLCQLATPHWRHVAPDHLQRSAETPIILGAYVHHINEFPPLKHGCFPADSVCADLHRPFSVLPGLQRSLDSQRPSSYRKPFVVRNTKIAQCRVVIGLSFPQRVLLACPLARS